MKLLGCERRWIRDVFATILPDGVVEGLPGASQVPWDPFLDDLAESAPFRLLAGLRLALFFVVFLAPLFVLGRLRTFSGLAPDDRLALLRGLRTSRFYLVRELPVLLKSISCLGHCGLPAVHQRLGIANGDREPPAWARQGGPSS